MSFVLSKKYSLHPMQRSKVLIATPVLLLGGTEIHVLGLSEMLVAAGYHVSICCYYEYDESVIKLFRKITKNIILMKLKRSEGLLILTQRLVKLYREHKPNIVHVQYLEPGLIPILAARIAGIKTIFSTVHIAGRIAYGKKAKILLRLASKFCTAFFCVSKGVEEFWFGNSQVLVPEKIDQERSHFTIYNAVDAEKIDTILKTTDANAVKRSLGVSDKRILGIVGRLAYQKGHAVLLNAISEVIRQMHDVVLLIIGIGPEEASLREKAHDLGIESYILWMGEITQEKVFQLYSIMDVLVMPSLYEGFGLAAAEAMAIGIPVVATKVSGLEEIVEDEETGMLIPAGDMSALSKSIVRLLSDSEQTERLGSKGRQKVRAVFSVDIFNRSWLAAYSDLS